MERGDIYLISLDQDSSHGQTGARPVLIVSPAAFNKLTGAPIVLPIVGGGSFARTKGFTVSLDEAPTETKGVIRCDRPGAIDMGSRGGRKIEAVPTSIIADVMAKLATILS